MAPQLAHLMPHIIGFITVAGIAFLLSAFAGILHIK